MKQAELIEFVRQRGLAVVATRDRSGAPEAALVGVAITDWAELVFDTSARSRKYVNLAAFPRVAVVVGWDDEVTVQAEGVADVLTGSERGRCFSAYVEQYPDGRERATDPDIALVRIRLDWVRRCDYRPDSFGIEEGASATDSPADASDTASSARPRSPARHRHHRRDARGARRSSGSTMQGRHCLGHGAGAAPDSPRCPLATFAGPPGCSRRVRH